MTMRKKLWITIVCLSVVLCTLVTGTIAWLTDETESVTNTFTPSNISVTLTEEGATENAQSFKMIPGTTLTKEATVTVDNDIDCYVFVKVEENLGSWTGEGNTFSAYLSYKMDTGWTQLKDASGNVISGVYCREVKGNATEESKSFNVLENNQITVNYSVTKTDMEKLSATDAKYPTLTFTAYAIQKDYLTDANGNAIATAAGAWELVKPADSTT